jgi:RecJ-like exonuclease
VEAVTFNSTTTQVPCELCSGPEAITAREGCQCCLGTGWQTQEADTNPFDDEPVPDLAASLKSTAMDRRIAERQHGFDRPSSHDQFDQGGGE